MAIMQYDTIIKYKITAVCEEPLHIGNAVGGKEDVLIHPVDQVPFIQASSIAGVFRDFYARGHKTTEVDALFGASRLSENSNASEYKSRMRFEDGAFVTNKNGIKMELRPHVKINHAAGTVDTEHGSGQKFDMEYVGAGAEVTFSVYLYVDSKAADVNYEEDMAGLLAAFRDGEFRFGAKKSNGAGKMKLQNVLFKKFNLKNESERKEWRMEDSLSEDSYEEYTNSLPKRHDSRLAYRISVKGRTEGAIQVKGIAVSEFGKGAPDSMNIRNAEGDFIIPGSSIKGAVRSQMEKISDYLNCPTVIEAAFGKGGAVKSEGKSGNLCFSDTVIGEQKVNDKAPVRHRIHIDKFTGGVINQGLFSEKNAVGDMTFSIDILDKNNPDATLGLLLFALRDLAIGTMSIGNGYSTGKGIIDVDNICIEAGKTGDCAEINFKEHRHIDDTKNIIASALSELKSVEVSA